MKMEAKKIIQMEISKRPSRSRDLKSEGLDRDEIERNVDELASLDETEFVAKKKAKAKELGLSVSVLDQLVSKKRRKTFGVDGRDFQLLPDGLYRVDEFNQPFDQLTSPFEIKGLCRTAEGMGYALIVDVQTPEGSATRVLVPRSALAGDGKEAIRLLLDAGLCLTQTDGAQRMLVRYLGSVSADSIRLLVDRPGWHGDVYVTPQGNLPAADESIIHGGGDTHGFEFSQAGTLQQWQTNVAAVAVGNPYLILFICAAFAAMLLPIVRIATFLLNLVGNSSSGKTTGLLSAISLYGPPSRLRTWRTTDNALEGLAAESNHALLALDEMKQCPPHIISSSIYSLGGEQSKTRATRSGGSRKPKKWSAVGASTSEKSIADLLRGIGEEPMAGQEVRMIEVHIDGSTPYGVYHTLHGAACGANLSDRLREATSQYYGTAAPAFIARIQSAGFDAVHEQAMEIIKRFEETYLPASSDGQVHRVCRRFALLAAAGEIASRWKITGWPQDEAYQAIGGVFAEWLANRGGVGSSEEQKILDQVTYFFEKYGRSRFELLDPPLAGEYRHTPAQRAGYYHTDPDGSVHHYVLAQTFRSELCAGYSPKLVIKVLSEAGILQSSASKVRKDPENKSIRVYHLINVIGQLEGTDS